MTMDSDPSQGTRASEPAPTDSIRNAIAFLCSLSRTPTATFRIGVSRDRASFAGSGSPVGEYHHFLCRFCRNVDRFSALPDDADLALGMGLECPGTFRVASPDQYRNGGHLQIQNRKTILSSDLGQGS